MDIAFCGHKYYSSMVTFAVTRLCARSSKCLLPLNEIQLGRLLLLHSFNNFSVSQADNQMWRWLWSLLFDSSVRASQNNALK